MAGLAADSRGTAGGRSGTYKDVCVWNEHKIPWEMIVRTLWSDWWE